MLDRPRVKLFNNELRRPSLPLLVGGNTEMKPESAEIVRAGGGVTTSTFGCGCQRPWPIHTCGVGGRNAKVKDSNGPRWGHKAAPCWSSQ